MELLIDLAIENLNLSMFTLIKVNKQALIVDIITFNIIVACFQSAAVN